MIISTSHRIAQAALQTSPGTPVVALNAEGQPVGFGYHLSTDAVKRAAELDAADTSIFGNAERQAKYMSLATSSLDSAAALLPAQASAIGIGSTALVFAFNAKEVVEATHSDNLTLAAIKSFECGIGAFSIAEQAGLFGQSAALKIGIVLAKNLSALASFAVHDEATTPGGQTRASPAFAGPGAAEFIGENRQ